MTQQHSFLPPSGASAWGLCAMWPLMNKTFPQDDSPESVEGTAAHWVNTEMMAFRLPAENSLAPNGVMVTGEMLDAGELWCEVAAARTAGMAPLHVEELVRIPQIHEECFGTPDLWAFNLGKNHLEILDFKFGHGFVDEFWNPQGLLYMLGILKSLEDKLCNPMTVTVSFTIVQPRCFYRGAPVRTHSYVVSEAADEIMRLKRAASAANDPRPLARTNIHCDHCPGRHACSALQESAYHDAEFTNDRLPHNLTPQAAALELRMLKRAQQRINARVDGLEELTLANLKRGERIAHFKLEAGKGKRVWNISTEQLATIGDLLGKKLTKIIPLTPKQAENYIDTSVITAYCSNIPGSVKLVPENNDQVRRVFGPSDHENFGTEETGSVQSKS